MLWTLVWALQLLAALALLLLLLISAVLLLITDPHPQVVQHEEENYYLDPATHENIPFPSINDKATVNLSVIVPAYNEEKRLPPMLDEAMDYLERRTKENATFLYELIVVSDGSTDHTVTKTESYSKLYGSEKVKCLKLVKNRGKGGAVRLGVQRAKGAAILFADADGATTFSEISKMEAALKVLTQADLNTKPEVMSGANAIVIGSRAHLEQESLASRSIFRTVLMYGFHFLVWLFTVRGIRDTQCGFKLFTRKAARTCFQSLHVDRWAFDVELLYIAQRLNIPISEVSVRWTEIEGSKVTPVWSWIQMGCDLGLIWLKYRIGAWKLSVSNID